MLLSGSASSKIVHSGKYPIDFIMLSPTLFFISSSELNPTALANPSSIFNSFRFVFFPYLKGERYVIKSVLDNYFVFARFFYCFCISFHRLV